MQTSVHDVIGRYANMSTPSSFAPSQQTNIFTTTTTTITNKSDLSNTTSSDVKADHEINANNIVTALCT